MALEIRKHLPHVKILGIDSNIEHCQEAIRLGIIDESVQLNEIYNADMVIVAIPVEATVTILPQALDNVKDDAIVFDVGSTKEDICLKVKKHPKRRNFLATHPIAGTEFSGPSAAIFDLFEGKTNIICGKLISSLNLLCIIKLPIYS